MYEIAASTGAEVARVAEANRAEAQAKFMSIVDTAVKNAPAGTENAVALVKSAVAAANNAFETAQKAGKQAAKSPKRTSGDVVDPPSAPPRRRRPELTLAEDSRIARAVRPQKRPGFVRAFSFGCSNQDMRGGQLCVSSWQLSHQAWRAS